MSQLVIDFDGQTYNRERDNERLSSQLNRVRDFMLSCNDWMTLRIISIYLEYPESSVSARLRDLRKEKFGGYNVQRRYVDNGLYEYKVTKGEKND